MSDALRRAAGVRPGAPALDDGNRVWSYAEMDAAVARMARRLAPLGAEPGGTVALVAHQSTLAVQALFAVPRTGATLAVLNPRLGPEALERALDDVAPDLLLSTEADVYELGVDRGWFTTLDDLPKPPPDHQSAEGLRTPTDVRRAFALLWTSGTSGTAGIVPITWAALDASAQAVSERLELNVEDRWYGSLSIAHIGGLALVHRVVHVGCCLVIRGPYSVGTFVDLLDRSEITHASLVPTMLDQLLDARGDAVGDPGGDRGVPEDLRCLLVGGAAASDRLVEAAVSLGYPVALTYGLTEACSQVATAPPALVREKLGTVGLPLSGVEVRVADDGEVSVKGPTVSETSCDEDGWLATGDQGLLDDEGHLWITGRSGEGIISGGVNVDPRRVEEIVLDMPGVTAAAVVGIPDTTWGEIVGALLVPESGPLDLESVEAALRERVSSSEAPRRLAIAEAIPRNANGKVDRVAVRALLLKPGLA